MNLWVVGDYGTVLYSSDGGENWEDLGLGSENDIFNIYVINKNKIIVSGSNGFIARIINNGELTEYLDVGYDSYITSMKFLSEKVGFVGIDSLKILKTTDGGDSWKEVYKGDPDDWIMSFEFIDNSEGWAVSDMGLILRTTDGGNSWNVVLNTGRPLNTCYFLNRNFGFITGYMGTIYKYTDIVNSAQDSDKICSECPYLVEESNLINIKNIKTDDKIEIFNSTGVSIYKAFSTSNEFSLSTHKFAIGLYFISINNKIFKFLKY
ncbi:MAG: YCF48-related protein [Candidatus Kapabacteria bacterium]|nr:YCF48-related protein [Candidatus Kapabacteria bacterium]